jgi:hypothetical protein
MRGAFRRWKGLALGLVMITVAVVALHHASSSAGDVVAQSRARGLESDAYFYTEVSDVRAFLDDQGRYGAAAPAQSTGDD